MPATSGYQAGVEANQTVVSYGQEVAYGVAPAVPFKAIRLTAETLASTRKRDRPAEFNTTGEVSAAVTTQVSAGGDLTIALSFGTFDDLMAGALNNDWGTSTTITAVAGDIAMGAPVAGVSTLTSTLAGKFTSAPVGTWVRVAGFTNAVNNGVALVTVNTGLTIGLIGLDTTVAETPTGVLASVKIASAVTNGTSVRSFFVQKKFSSALFLNYPGSYVSAMSLSGGVGKFMTGSFTLLSQTEVNSMTESSTGATVAAPAGLVNDSVGSFGGIFRGNSPLSAVVDSFTVTITSDGAALEYGMGSAAAQGLLAGLCDVTGTIKMYFKDFRFYTQFVLESGGPLEFLTQDAAGNAYVVSILNCKLMNPTIQAGGQNQAVMASFTIEGNPLAASQGTVKISRV